MARHVGKACYGVARGRHIGVFISWNEAERHVINFPGAQFKSFPCMEAAATWVFQNRVVDDTRPLPELLRPVRAPKATPQKTQRSASEGSKKAEPAKKVEEHYSLHFDGAAKGNPGVGGAGAWLADSDGNEVWALRHRMDRATCNEAEYTAVVLGLERCVEEKRGRVAVYGDSKLVIEQLSGRWKVKARHLISLSKRGRTAAKALSASLHHIPRAQNWRADCLANEAVAKLPAVEWAKRLCNA
eukprot:TRINITY_DN754_c2_g1_i5.p1 TRINITY_DN754_c2_g1~~TRINITY_DN754_c2_g1_i5.p1  ORF type:complete len:243 (+),score=49.53 TRINITY_DN754_c2_g1_i5:110-838(+)